MKILCALFTLLLTVSLSFAQTVVGPQSVGPPGVVVGADGAGNLIGHVPTIGDIATPNPQTASNSSIYFGGPQIQLGVDNPNGIVAGNILFVQVIPDTDNFAYCVVTAIDAFGFLSCNITFIQGGGAVFSQFAITVVNGYDTNSVPPWAGMGVDGTTAVTFPTVGQTVNLTLDTGKVFQYSSPAYCYAFNDPQNSWFAGFFTSYNTSTGASSIVATAVSSVGANQTGWTCSLAPLAGPNASLNNWASDNLTIPSTTPTDMTFTTVVASQYFPIQGQVLITCTTATTKQMTGQVKAYSGSTMVVTVTSVLAGGGTACSAWAFYLTTGPTTRISLYQMNGLVMSGIGTTTLTVTAGSVRDSTDTVDLVLPSSATISTGSSTSFVTVAGNGTISPPTVGTTIPGTGSNFTSLFTASGKLTDLDNQTAAFGIANVRQPSVISWQNGGSNTYETTTVTNDTSLAVPDTIASGATNVAYSRGGQPTTLLANIGAHAVYGAVLARKDADGTIAVEITSFTISGTPDLPSGYTYYRVLGYFSTFNTSPGGSFQNIVSITQIMGAVTASVGVAGQCLVSNGAAYQPSSLCPKAVYSATITPTTVTGSISSVNTGTGVITWSTNHGLTTGQCVRGIGTVPTGFTVGQMFYVNALSATTFALYTTLANALADTSRVTLSTTTTGATMVDFVYSGVFSIGFSAVAPVCGTPGSTTQMWDLNLTNALATTAGLAECFAGNMVDSAGTTRGSWMQSLSNPAFTSTVLIQFNVGANQFTNTAGTANGTWAQQATTAETVRCKIWGALDEPIPANDNDLIERAVA